MFLDQQKELDGAIVDYTFTSFSLRYLMRSIASRKEGETEFEDMAGYKDHETNIYSV